MYLLDDTNLSVALVNLISSFCRDVAHDSCLPPCAPLEKKSLKGLIEDLVIMRVFFRHSMMVEKSACFGGNGT